MVAVSAWHYKDVGDLKDLKGDVQAIHQQNGDQEARINAQREISLRKVDKDTYDRDVRDLRDGQNRLQNSIDNLTRIVIDTRETGHR